MSLFFRSAGQVRDAFPYPEIPPNSAAGSYSSDFANAAPADAESAQRKVAVWSSINLLATLVAMLPADGITGDGDDKRQADLPAFFNDPDGSGQGWSDWVTQLLWSWFTRGNAVGRILDTDTRGRPTQIALQHPDRVSVQRDWNTGQPIWRFGAKVVPLDEVWHRRVFPVPGRIMGLSPIERHAVTIGQGQAAAAFGWRWFTDGAHPSAILQHETRDLPDPKDAATVKQRFLAALRGTREPVVFGKGWKYTPIQVSAEESQFLDTQQYTAAECCRIYGPGIAEVLGYETGGSLTYSNIEGRRLDLLTFTLDPWITRIETILSNDVMTRPRRLKLNRGKLLATDLLTRYQSYQIGIRNRFLLPDEVRNLEDRPPFTDEQKAELATTPATPAPIPVTQETP